MRIVNNKLYLGNKQVAAILFGNDGEISSIHFTDGSVELGPVSDDNGSKNVISGGSVSVQGNFTLGDSYQKF